VARRAARRRLLRLHRASGYLCTSHGSSCSSLSTTSPPPRARVPRHVARLITRLVTRLVVDYFASRRLVGDYFHYATRPGASACRAARHVARRAARRRLLCLRRASGCLGTSRGSSRSSSSTTSPPPRVWVPRHVARLIVDYFDYAAHLVGWARRAARCAARRRLLRLRRESGCLGTSCGSSSTTSITPRIRLLRYVARLVAYYFAYAARPVASARRVARRRLVIDYFDYAARPVASARHAARRVARHAARRAARRRLLRLRRASGCLSMSRGSSSSSSSTTSPPPRIWLVGHVARLVVDYFASVARPGASARHAARRAARRRLLRLRRASGCFGTSRGSSRDPPSSTSPTPRVRVPRHVTRLVTWPNPLWARFTPPFALGACLFISSASAGRHIHSFIKESPIRRRSTGRKSTAAARPRVA
jgi:hypothetical protein